MQHIQHIDPILNVADIDRSLRFYVDVLHFSASARGTNEFTHIVRDGHGIYLCHGAQGGPETWLYLGIEDARAMHRHLTEHGAKLLQEPTNKPWGLEIRVEDPDGHVLRMASERE